MGTTEKATGLAEPAGTDTCWASIPPPARHSPSTGDTWTLTWGQENRDGQGALIGSGPLSDLSLAAPLLPPALDAPAPMGTHSHVIIQIVVENRPQFKLLKAADRDRQAQVQVEFSEHSNSNRLGYTQACGDGARTEIYLRPQGGRIWR